MKIFINEKVRIIEDKLTLFQVKDLLYKDSDVIILNGFQTKEDKSLKENDRLIFIKKGQLPKNDEIEYLLTARHTPGVHQKIKQACVGIAGLGGLGSNIAISLARLGVGKLILVDYDIVEPSNLNRQQYYIRHIGTKKTEAIKQLLNDINPFVDVESRSVF